MLPDEIQQMLRLLPEDHQAPMRMVVSFYEGKIKQLEQENKQLQSQVKALQEQLSQNSSNSSKPPSSDPQHKPAPKSGRPKTGRKPGGQKGHKGTNLQMTATPDIEKRHEVAECACCQKDLRDQKADDLQKRQVYDLPPMKLVVTEHQAEVKRCSCGHLNRAGFPEDVHTHVQYGPGLKSFLVYLQDYQLVPYERTCELVQDLFGHTISAGTLHNVRRYAFDQLASFEERLKMVLTAAAVAGFDETGIRVLAKKFWLHSCSTDRHVHYTVHARRGGEAMKAGGILPDFEGIAVHDFFKSYFQFDCRHALCNAHLLRELTFISEHYPQKWAKEVAIWLIKMQQAKEKAIKEGKKALSAATVRWYHRMYRKWVQEGLQANPLEPPPEGKKKRGPMKKSKPRNLLERLWNYEHDILQFLDDFRVPFDNNFSERDLRMMKAKLKISGGFRSLEGAQFFARIRSYIMTSRKQGHNPLLALRDVFMNNTLASQLTAVAGC